MDIITELKKRNVINNITNEDKAKEFLNHKDWSLYIGFDPSFKSLHLGNYLMLVTLKRFINAGFKPFAIIGGATGQIGDPSGKKSERILQSKDVIESNAECIQKQITKILKDIKIINNFDFYKNLYFLDFLRDTGKYINVNYLLEKEIISKRLEAGISYAEFSYNLIQANDFLQLYNNYNVVLQLGGSDQWGNITTGIELIRKKVGDNNNAFGMTLNLLTKADGTKFGKSESGAIYLDPQITHPYSMYQFLINQSDADVYKLLMSLTFLSIDEINQIMEKHNLDKAQRLAQKTLAKEIVSDIHGAEACKKCMEISAAFFNNKIEVLNHEDLLAVLNNMPSFKTNKDSYKIIDLLVDAKIVASKSQARTLISSNGIYLNNKLVNDLNLVVAKSSAINKQFSYIRKGKKNYFLIIWG